jgi:hypothetical protein
MKSQDVEALLKVPVQALVGGLGKPGYGDA